MRTFSESAVSLKRRSNAMANIQNCYAKLGIRSEGAAGSGLRGAPCVVG